MSKSKFEGPPSGKIRIPRSPIVSTTKTLKDAERKGYRKGYAKGKAAGFLAGKAVGLLAGLTEGKAIGYAQGERDASNNFGKYNP